MLRVIRNHRRAAHGDGGYEALAVNPVPLDHACPQRHRHPRRAWDEALALGEQHGYRNAQTTVIAPTGTIGLVMDCDTTGIEPDFALVKFKKLAGGGYFKIINRRCRKRCARSAIPKRDRRDRSLCRRPRLAGRRRASTLDAEGQGLHRRSARQDREALPTAFDIKFASTSGRWARTSCATR
jgi:ribonucleoside-diphosphate reductase alpha chain